MGYNARKTNNITGRHTHTKYDSSEQVISPSQKPLPTQHNTRTLLPSGGFEAAAIEWPQTYALDRAATGIGLPFVWLTCKKISSVFLMTTADTKDNLRSANQRKSSSAGKNAALQVRVSCMSSYGDSYGIRGCWQVLSPTYFPMYFVWWLEYFVWC